jgi:hypothetical protein
MQNLSQLYCISRCVRKTFPFFFYASEKVTFLKNMRWPWDYGWKLKERIEPRVFRGGEER